MIQWLIPVILEAFNVIPNRGGTLGPAGPILDAKNWSRKQSTIACISIN